MKISNHRQFHAGRKSGNSQGESNMRRRESGFTLIELLVTVAIIGILAAIVIPNMLQAIDKSRQNRTMSDLRTLGTALEEYNIDHSAYPVMASEAAMSGSALELALEPVFIRILPTEDAWQNGMRYSSDGKIYTAGSLSRDGRLGGSLVVSGFGGATTQFDCDIVFVNGQFLQWPEGAQLD
jgi:general secretion pathway protein G